MDHTVQVLLEVGGVLAVLAVMARLAGRLAISPIPLYLAAGLAFGDGGLLPLNISEEFVETGAERGVILLLLMLGLEHWGRELTDPSVLPGVVVPVVALGIVTMVTKAAVGAWFGGDRRGIGTRADAGGPPPCWVPGASSRSSSPAWGSRPVGPHACRRSPRAMSC